MGLSSGEVLEEFEIDHRINACDTNTVPATRPRLQTSIVPVLRQLISTDALIISMYFDNQLVC